MTITLTGNNTYALRRKLDELTAEFIKKYGDLAVEKFDGEDVEFQAILDAVQSLPFLAKRKLVVVRDAGKNKALADHIEQIISSITDSTDLVFFEPLTDKRTSFYKTLKAKTQFEELNELDDRSLAKWLVDEAKNQSGELSLTDATYMVQRLGPNQQLLANELAKLITFEPKVSRQSIDLLTDPTPQTKIFDLLDSVFGSDRQKALKIYSEQRAQRVEPAAILAMIAWQLNILTICKLAGDRKPAQIAKDSGLSPYPVNKGIALAKKISLPRLRSQVKALLEMDYKSKTQTYDLDEALKTYIATM